MNVPMVSAGTGSFTSCLKAISDMGKASTGTLIKLQGIEFSDLMAQQNALPELLEELKGLLPEQDFSQIEALFLGGNSLPLAAGSGSEESLPVSSEEAVPVVTNLAVLQQQLAVAQLAKKEPHSPVKSPLPENLTLPISADGKPAVAAQVAGVVADPTINAPAKVEPAVTGFVTQLESIVPVKRSLQAPDPAVAVGNNPLPAVLKTVETAPLRFSAAAQLSLDTPLHAKGWEQGVGDRVVWMLSNSVQSVSLRISPAHLGPVEIQLSVNKDQATVSFAAQHAVVREALEAGIPRLREMFQENNLQLTHVDVGQRGNTGQQTAGGGARDGHYADNQGGFDQVGHSVEEGEERTVLHSAIEGLLNDYA